MVLSVHTAKTRHSGRMFGRKTARKRPKRDRIGFNATELVLAQDPRTCTAALADSWSSHAVCVHTLEYSTSTHPHGLAWARTTPMRACDFQVKTRRFACLAFKTHLHARKIKACTVFAVADNVKKTMKHADTVFLTLK